MNSLWVPSEREPPNLCDECAQIDFDYLFKPRTKRNKKKENRNCPRNYSQVASLGTRLSQTASCSLCRFFWHIRVPTEDGSLSGDREYDLLYYAYPLWNRTMASPYSDNIFLAVVPHGYCHSSYEKYIKGTFGNYPLLCRGSRVDVSSAVTGQYQTGAVGRPIGPEPDIRIAHNWLEQCRRLHTEKQCCERPQLQWAIKEEIRGFRLINCTTTPPAVERCTGKEVYAALSYVWGRAGSGTAEEWPKVILDAIEVTRQLGLSYLWVDKYCIDQEDGHCKNTQIQAMGEIYQGAELTIFATAGTDASHGLAGIRGTPRNSQHQVNVGGHLLVSTYPDPKQKVQDSVWASRGWTYQETFFSRRKLFFTEDQMFWQCRAFVTEESIDSRWDGTWKVHCTRYTSPIEYSLEVLQWSLATKSLLYEDMVPKLWKHIANYSHRNLTFEGDAINAIKGVIRQYSVLENGGLDTILGLPVFSKPDEAGRYHLSGSLALSLCWVNNNVLGDINLGNGPWPSQDFEGFRRKRFPSWTWTGWKTPIGMHPSLSGKVHFAAAFRRLVDPEEGSSIEDAWLQDVTLLDPDTGVVVELTNMGDAAENGAAPKKFEDDERFFLLRLPSPYVLRGKDLYQWYSSVCDETQPESIGGATRVPKHRMSVWLGDSEAGRHPQPKFWDAVCHQPVIFVLLYQQITRRYMDESCVCGLFLILEPRREGEREGEGLEGCIWERRGLLEVVIALTTFQHFHHALGTRKMGEPVIIG